MAEIESLLLASIHNLIGGTTIQQCMCNWLCHQNNQRCGLTDISGRHERERERERGS